MNAIRTIARELAGLVVDDLGFAVAVIGWIALTWLLSAYVLPPTPWVAVLLFGGLCLCCLPSLARSAEEVDGRFTLEEVAPQTFVRKGLHEDASAQNADAIANIGFLIGRDGVLVTESGGSLADGQWLRAEIGKRPVWLAASTHPGEEAAIARVRAEGNRMDLDVGSGSLV